MKTKVLIADDEEAILALLRVTLAQDSRFTVLEARDGEEVLRVVRGEYPYIVVLDILMPKQDGVSVCRTLKRDPATAHVKVIVLTAMTQDVDRQRALEAGADAYLTKPFSPVGLMETLESLLDGR